MLSLSLLQNTLCSFHCFPIYNVVKNKMQFSAVFRKEHPQIMDIVSFQPSQPKAKRTNTVHSMSLNIEFEKSNTHIFRVKRTSASAEKNGTCRKRFEDSSHEAKSFKRLFVCLFSIPLCPNRRETPEKLLRRDRNIACHFGEQTTTYDHCLFQQNPINYGQWH